MQTPTLLHIDASPRTSRSKSRQLGREFLEQWRQHHPSGRVLTRDLAVEPPPFVSEAWVEGAFTPETGHSSAAREAMSVSNRYIDELVSAQHLVITTPIYNLSLPAALKAWIDQIVRVGRTFKMANGGFQGLATGKRALIIVTSGSDFRPNTPGGAYNFLEPYVRAVLGFIGITDVAFVYAHSTGSDEQIATQAFAAAEAQLARLAEVAA